MLKGKHLVRMANQVRKEAAYIINSDRKRDIFLKKLPFF
jgi:hypothetical protein